MFILRTVAFATATAIITVGITVASGAAQAPFYATNGDATLAALLTEALEGNPRVRGAFLEHEAARSRVSQASSLPDPALSFTQHVRGPQTRVGPQASGISLSQAFPWFGTRSDLRGIAAADAGIRGQSYHERRAEVVHEVKLAYYDIAYLDRALSITEEEERLLVHYESLAQARYSQGFGQQQEVVKLQAEVTRVLNRRQNLLRERADFAAALNVLTDRPVGAAVPPVAIGELPDAHVDDELLRATGIRERAEVASARLRIESREHAVRLAQRRARPGFTVGVAWGNVLGRRDDPGLVSPPGDNGQDQFSLTLGASIPVFRSNYDAAVREAAAQLSAAEEAYRDEVSGVAFAVRSTASRLAAIERQVALFERALLPQAEQALRATEEAYSGGVAGVLELLDSEEMLLDVRLGLARLRADYMKALAGMERATGAPFPEEGS